MDRDLSEERYLEDEQSSDTQSAESESGVDVDVGSERETGEPRTWVEEEPETWDEAEPGTWDEGETGERGTWHDEEPGTWDEGEPGTWDEGETGERGTWHDEEPGTWDEGEPGTWDEGEPGTSDEGDTGELGIWDEGEPGTWVEADRGMRRETSEPGASDEGETGKQEMDQDEADRIVHAHLGATPFLADKEQGQLRDWPVPDRELTSYADAKALLDDPEYRPMFEQFELDALERAAEWNVTIERMSPVVGVFEGKYEPSYSIEVSGRQDNIAVAAQELGVIWNQKAVVGFTQEDREHIGGDLELRFRSANADKDAVFQTYLSELRKAPELQDKADELAGMTFDPDNWSFFIPCGKNADAIANAIVDVAESYSLEEPEYAFGKGNFWQLREGPG